MSLVLSLWMLGCCKKKERKKERREGGKEKKGYYIRTFPEFIPSRSILST